MYIDLEQNIVSMDKSSLLIETPSSKMDVTYVTMCFSYLTNNSLQPFSHYLNNWHLDNWALETCVHLGNWALGTCVL